MTRTTSSHHTATYELSPVAALRALRTIAYRDFDAYRPAAETSSWAFISDPELSDVLVLEDSMFDDSVFDDSVFEDSVFEDSVLEDSVVADSVLEDTWTDGTWIDEIDLRDEDGDALYEAENETTAAAAEDGAQSSRVWYLNEVPAEWIEDSFAPGQGSTPISA